MIKQGIFSESGWVAKVNILEDNCDSEWEKYKLEVVETQNHSPIFETPKDGHIFDVSAKRQYRHYVDWHLYILSTEKGAEG